MIHGHQKNLKIFSQYIKENRFPHALLFAGPDKIGKKKVAIKIAKYLEGNHSGSFFDFSQGECSCKICKSIDSGNFFDILTIGGVNDDKTGKKEILIKEIRDIKKKLLLKTPFPFKIVIIENVEKLNKEAAGAFLKMLEEPRGETIFFLLTPIPGVLLQTILSRVEIFRFHLFRKEEIKLFLRNTKLDKNLSEKTLNQVIDLSLGRPEMASELALDKSKVLYYNTLIEEIRKAIKSPISERFLIADFLEKKEKKSCQKIEEFLFWSELWFQDLLFKKVGLSSKNISFSYKEKELEEGMKDFSKAELKFFLKAIQAAKNYLLFANVNRLLVIENLLLKM